MEFRYCLLIGDNCPYFPVKIIPGLVFIAEPYDEKRKERERIIINLIEGYEHCLADHETLNISLTCKICNKIQSSQFGIVDITGLNENVLIELGMLFGFNKPVIILVEKKEDIEFHIPSNIKGIEQIRYKNFLELEQKLGKSFQNLVEFWRKGVDYQINLQSIIAGRIHLCENLIKFKTMDFSCIIISFQEINGRLTPIINRGQKHYISKGMIFELFFHKVKIAGETLDEPIGYLEIIHVQDKISHTVPWILDKNHSFWRNAFVFKPPQKHILKPHIPSQFEDVPVIKIEEYLENLKQIRYISF